MTNWWQQQPMRLVQTSLRETDVRVGTGTYKPVPIQDIPVSLATERTPLRDRVGIPLYAGRR